MTTPLSYNLIDQPWIPVHTRAGEPKRVSLREALTCARELEGVHARTPAQNVAIYRLLATIASRALEAEGVNARDHQEARLDDPSRDQALADAISAYLEAHHQRFDLFGDKPFMQVAGLEREPEGWHRLSAATSKDLLFDHNVQVFAPPALHAGEAAIRLLETHAFVIVGGSGYGAATDPGTLHVIPLGDDLITTLTLNLLDSSWYMANHTGEDDAPAWEQPPLTPERLQRKRERNARGIYDYLTWQPRAIQLLPERQPDGSLGVRSIRFDRGEIYRSLPNLTPNPWAAYASKRNEPTTRYPIGARVEHLLWTDLARSLATPTGNHLTGSQVLRNVLDLLAHQASGRVRLHMAGNVVLGKLVAATVSDDFTIAADAFDRERVETFAAAAVDSATRVLRTLDKGISQVARAMLDRANDSKLDSDRVKSFKRTLDSERVYYDALRQPFAHALERLTSESLDAATETWRDGLLAAVDATVQNAHARVSGRAETYLALAKGEKHFNWARKEAREFTP